MTRSSQGPRRHRAALAAALLLAPLPFLGSAAQAEEKPIVIVRDMDFGSLDPDRGYCDTCQIYFNATYDTLIGLSQQTTFYPKIATSWEVNGDIPVSPSTLTRRRCSPTGARSSPRT